MFRDETPASVQIESEMLIFSTYSAICAEVWDVLEFLLETWLHLIDTEIKRIKRTIGKAYVALDKLPSLFVS